MLINVTPAAPWQLIAGLPTVRTVFEASTAGPVFGVRLGAMMTPERRDGTWCTSCPRCGSQIALVALDVTTALAGPPTFDTNPTEFLAAWLCVAVSQRAAVAQLGLHRHRIISAAFAVFAGTTGRVSTDPDSLRLLARVGQFRSVPGLRIVARRLVEAGLLAETLETWTLTLPPAGAQHT